MPNEQNINRLINIIELADPENCEMGLYGVANSCNTAHCIGGWITYLLRADSEEDYIHSEDEERTDFLGISKDRLVDLELMSDTGMRLADFDRLPPPVRKAAMLEVLKILRSEGFVDWDYALEKAGAKSYPLGEL